MCLCACAQVFVCEMGAGMPCLGCSPGPVTAHPCATPPTRPPSHPAPLLCAPPCCRSSAVDMVAVDSVAALVPRAELEGEIGQTQGAPVGPARGRRQ